MILTKWLTGIFCLTLALQGFADSPEKKGLKIIKEQEKRDRGWRDSKATLQMILVNKNGKKTVRDMRIQALEVKKDGDKSLTIFDKPKDVRGTALLTYSHALDPDEQWLYLPALKRVKRIASKNKSGPFMGSEFAFEDLTSFEVEKYTYKYLRDEACPPDPKEKCFVVESYPVDKNSGYSKQVVWIDQSEYRTHYVEFYDRKKSLLKTLTASKFKKYKKKYWRALHSLMENKQSGKSTILEVEKIQFRTGLKAKDFSQNSLKRSR